jgi:hypothetical protein
LVSSPASEREAIEEEITAGHDIEAGTFLLGNNNRKRIWQDGRGTTILCNVGAASLTTNCSRKGPAQNF